MTLAETHQETGISIRAVVCPSCGHLPNGPELSPGMADFRSGVRAVGILRVEACRERKYRHGPRHVLRELPCGNS